MNIAREDITAARTPSQTSHYQPGYDCPLPNDALSELLGKRLPQRARIVGKPPSPPKKRALLDSVRRWWHPAIGWLLGMIFTVALYSIVNWFGNKHESRPVPAPPPVVQPAPATLSQPSTPIVAPIQPAPRATFVPVTVRRATLLRLPVQELGVYKWYDLPSAWGGGSVWARYCGTVGRFSEIPANPTPGDLWNVTETGAGWIFCTPVGYSHAVWIDP